MAGRPIQVLGLRVFRYDLPLVAPLMLKGRTLTHRQGLLIRAEGADGTVGWGEAAPLPGFSRENLDEAARQIKDLEEYLIGRRAGSSVEDSSDQGFEAIPESAAPSVRFGLELALLSLRIAGGTTWAEWLGRSLRSSVYVNGLLTSGTKEAVVNEARALIAAGYRTVKLKVGRRPLPEEIDLVCTLRQELGDGVAIRLDANRAWRDSEARAFALATADVGIEYVEEPLREASGLQRLVEETGLPVALDESLPGMDPSRLAAHSYARAVVLKPTLLGGIGATLAFVRAAEAGGMIPVLSAAFESGVALSAMAVLAAGIGSENIAMGFDPYRWLADDVLRPRLEIEGGRIDIARLLQCPGAIHMDVLEEV